MSSVPQPEHSGRDPAAEPRPNHGIGERLARLRGARGIKVSALARQVGVSPSLISQIERGQSRPSVSTLFELSQALEVPVDAFFRDGAEEQTAAPAAPASAPAAPTSAPPGPGDATSRRRHRYLVRHDERDVIEIEGGVQWESLTPRPLEELEFLELVYAPHAESSPRLYRHPGTEIALVLSGVLHIHVAFERFELHPGDSIHFPSSLPHRYVNPGDETARAVTVILHDNPPDDPPETKRRP
jgi:transcriptional regulator with XRE-family HTH domain